MLNFTRSLLCDIIFWVGSQLDWKIAPDKISIRPGPFCILSFLYAQQTTSIVLNKACKPLRKVILNVVLYVFNSSESLVLLN